MKQLIILTILIYAIFRISTPVYADESTRQKLQKLAIQVKREDQERAMAADRAVRIQKVKNILTMANSPMSGYSDRFVDCASRYGVDYKLLLGLAWKESNYGKAGYAIGSNNAYGYGIHLGMKFKDWGEGTCTVAKGLSENYEHHDIVKTITRYAPPSENNTRVYIDQLSKFIKSI